MQDGVDLVKMNATLLEKVEELTLYSIQLEKASREHQLKFEQLELDKQKQQEQIDELKQLVKQLAQKK